MSLAFAAVLVVTMATRPISGAVSVASAEGAEGGASDHSARRAGILHLSRDIAEPHSLIEARGRVVPAAKRRVVLQRWDQRRWTWVTTGSTGRRGRYALTTRLPVVRASFVRYRVLLPRWRVRGTVLTRWVTRAESVRIGPEIPTTGPTPTAQPATQPTAQPTAETVTSPTTSPTTSPSTPTPGPPAPPADAMVAAEWRMDEPAGSTVMVDSSGRGHHGTVSRDAAAAGLTLDGSAYHWSTRCRDCLPVALPRVVQVPDSADLEIPDPSLRWSLELRFRTSESHGNIMQKGQATSPGGQIKVEDAGALRCVFKGADGRAAVAVSPTPLDDGAWHTVVCVHTATAVAQWVDGVLVARTISSTGRIDNDQPFVVAGKTACNQRTVGCDYYSGSVDWARISHG